MYTVLIADDEQNIREGLKYIIEWEALGFCICGETSNGKDTLQFILEKSPDLVLLDIRMPKMYGTDIIRAARENGYGGKFIILSGYSDFTYAQAAIRYHACFYLTKPIEEDELSDAVSQIAADLTAERNEAENMALLTGKAKTVVLREILAGTYDLSDTGLPLSGQLAEMNLLADIYQVVIYETYGDCPAENRQSFAELLKVTNRGHLTFEHYEEKDSEVILLKGGFALHKFRDFLNYYDQAPIQPGSPLDSLFLAYGRPVDSLAQVPLSYKEALALQKRRFFCQQGQHTLGFDELPAQKEENGLSHEALGQYGTKLADYLLSFNRGMVAETLFSLEEYLYHTDDIPAVKLFLTDLYLIIKEKINLTYSMENIPFPANGAAISHISQCRRLYEIIRYISEMTDMIMDATGSPSRNTVLDDIVYYIDHNYQNNIKLESIAPLFGYNSAYLGKIFNKHFGESFNSYVDHKRIGHSQELLKEKNLKVYEIAEAVGYKNVDYFHKKFRKYTGLSPAEYRRKYGQSVGQAPSEERQEAAGGTEKGR